MSAEVMPSGIEKEASLTRMLAKGDDAAVALSAPSARPLAFGALRDQIAVTGAALRGIGVARSDRAAIVLPNGPEMAVAFMAVASAAIAAPLNPACKADEFEFYLEDLNARLLIVEQGSRSPAIAIAEKLGLRVFAIVPRPELGAGAFSLADGTAGGLELTDSAAPDDIALVLHTSGTTSRPKIVPLTQRNLCASAFNIAQTLRLTPADRCLSIMPQFHIHGLAASLLAPLAAGGSVFCAPGFNALRFFSWVEEAKPTWYTAVPTMHQTILTRALHNKDVLRSTRLRFIRSSSAALPKRVFAELEAAFDCPVIESYGMTEAAHQMASNLLPPGQRKPGTVGAAAGPDIAVMGQDGTILQPGSVGEVVIRGDNVTAGYENNAKATAEAFAHGWFHTGDQGVIDAAGYLTITGRLKEIINRGGEKISPAEVDGVLLDHPAVAQAVTFAMPHGKLGEDVAAAVILKDGAEATERDIRDFAASRLAGFKVPRKVLFVGEIPKGATGKLQRIGLAAKLGLTGSA